MAVLNAGTGNPMIDVISTALGHFSCDSVTAVFEYSSSCENVLAKQLPFSVDVCAKMRA